MAMMFKNRTVNSSYQVGSCGKCRDNYLTQAHCLSGKKLKKINFVEFVSDFSMFAMHFV